MALTSYGISMALAARSRIILMGQTSTISCARRLAALLLTLLATISTRRADWRMPVGISQLALAMNRTATEPPAQPRPVTPTMAAKWILTPASCITGRVGTSHDREEL